MKIRYSQGNLKKTFGKNSNGAIKYIVIHETDNTAPTADADAHARLQARGNTRDASWHYQVDAKEVVQSYTHDVACWHAGKGNRGSIAVELCVNGGFNNAAFGNLLELVGQLKKQYPNAQVVQHNYFTGKNCPRNIRAKGLWSQVVSKAPATTATPKPAKRTHIGIATVKVDSLNLRDKPNLNSKVIKSLPKGSKWKVYNINADGWIDLGGGWVSNKNNAYVDIQLLWN